MKKLSLLLLCGCVFFSSSFVSFATDAEAVTTTAENTGSSEEAESGWIKIIGDVPDGFLLDLSVTLVDDSTKSESQYRLTPEKTYIVYEKIPSGSYHIDSVEVLGKYEGIFVPGFSTSSFKVSENNGDAMVIPVYLESAADCSADPEEENPYAGMTYEEVLKAQEAEIAEAEKAEAEYQTNDTPEDVVISDQQKEEYSDKVKEEYEAKKEELKKEEESKNNIQFPWGSLIFTLVVLGGLGIGFYFVKRKNSL